MKVTLNFRLTRDELPDRDRPVVVWMHGGFQEQCYIDSDGEWSGRYEGLQDAPDAWIYEGELREAMQRVE